MNQKTDPGKDPVPSSKESEDWSLLLQMAEEEYRTYLKQYTRLLDRKKDLPEPSVVHPDPSLYLARVQVEKSAMAVKRMRDRMLIIELKQDEMEWMGED